MVNLALCSLLYVLFEQLYVNRSRFLFQGLTKGICGKERQIQVYVEIIPSAYYVLKCMIVQSSDQW